MSGSGVIDGRGVCVYGEDGRVDGGCLGEIDGKKIVCLMDVAGKNEIGMMGVKD
nr:carboxyl transferase domain-containing protein [Bacillus pumilus]